MKSCERLCADVLLERADQFKREVSETQYIIESV